jgi:hypothetical protein
MLKQLYSWDLLSNVVLHQVRRFVPLLHKQTAEHCQGRGVGVPLCLPLSPLFVGSVEGVACAPETMTGACVLIAAVPSGLVTPINPWLALTRAGVVATLPE